MSQQAIGSTKIDWRIINALRGLAALYVVIHHARHKLFTDTVTYAQQVKPRSEWGLWEWLNILLLQQTSLGIEFVILFFILSGFSISHSLSGRPDLGGFYKRRLIRLYPTYLTGIAWAVLVLVIVRYAAPNVYFEPTEGRAPLKEVLDGFINLKSFVQKLLYMPIITTVTIQYWSLPLEVIFYLVAPFAIRRLRWFAIIVALMYLAGWVLHGSDHMRIGNDTMFLQLTYDYGIYFMLGMLFYKYKDKILSGFRLNKVMVFVVAAILFEIVVITKSYVWHHMENKWTGMLMVLFSFVLLFGFMKNAIRIKWLEHIGEYSYTLYVTHVASIQLLSIITYHMGMGFYAVNSLYVWYFGILVSVILAYLLYYIGEYPSTKYLDKLRKQKLR